MTYWCKIEDCPRRSSRRGWCENHYMRWYRTGTPLGRSEGFGWINFHRARVNLVHNEDALRQALTEPHPFYARQP